LRYNEITMRRWLDQKLLRNRGFTIVELLIVIAVIGVLATIVVVGYGAVVSNTRDTALKADLENIADTIKLEALDINGIPAGGATSSLTGDSTILSGVYVTPSVDLYDVAVNNLFYCAGTLAGNDEFAIVAKGVTGKVFAYVSNEGITELDPIPSPWDYSGICPDAGFTAPYTWSYGYNPDPLYGWFAWAEAEGTIASGCPEGYIVVPGNATFGTNDFCVMKYEAKNVGGVATSVASGTPWVSISQTSAISTATAACAGCHLITEAEWLTIAHDVLNVASNWSGGSVGSGYIYSGHNDATPGNSLEASTDDNDGYIGTGQSGTSSQRRTLTLSNGEVIWDLAGDVYEWTQGTMPANQQPGLVGEVAFSWKDYNNGSLIQDGLSSAAFPAYGTPAASAWASAQGIGQLMSNYGDSTMRGMYRGGRWTTGGSAGIFNLVLDNIPSYTGVNIGFRVAK
jgi:prepilin-type N-terminal cleavage/methylation domain-containing protein